MRIFSKVTQLVDVLISFGSSKKAKQQTKKTLKISHICRKTWMSCFDWACLGSAGLGSTLLVGFKASLSIFSFWNKDPLSEAGSRGERKKLKGRE